MYTDQEMIGHDRIFTVLKRLFYSKKMGHAYLFSGPRHSGKHTIARALTRCLPHTEFLEVNRSVDKEGKRMESITIDQIRDIVHVLSLSLQNEEWYRVVFFNESEYINQQAENALLKSLEEPPERTIFFFFEHTVGRLLPTIRSRCSFIRFGLVHDATIRKASEKKSADYDTDEIVRLSAGRPGIAHTLRSRDARELLKSRIAHFGRYGEMKFQKEDTEIAELAIHQDIQNMTIGNDRYQTSLARYDALKKIQIYSEAHVYQPGLIEAFL